MGFLSPPKLEAPVPPPAPPPPPAFGLTKQPPPKKSTVPTFLSGLGGSSGGAGATGSFPGVSQGKTLLGQ